MHMLSKPRDQHILGDLIEQQGMCSLHIVVIFSWTNDGPFYHLPIGLPPHPASVQLETYASM